MSVWLIGSPCQRCCDTSSLFFWSSISNNDDIVVVRKKLDSAQICLAEIGLVIVWLVIVMRKWSAQELSQFGYWRKIFQFAWFQTIQFGNLDTLAGAFQQDLLTSHSISQAISHKSNDSLQKICHWFQASKKHTNLNYQPLHFW